MPYRSIVRQKSIELNRQIKQAIREAGHEASVRQVKIGWAWGYELELKTSPRPSYAEQRRIHDLVADLTKCKVLVDCAEPVGKEA